MIPQVLLQFPLGDGLYGEIERKTEISLLMSKRSLNAMWSEKREFFDPVIVQWKIRQRIIPGQAIQSLPGAQERFRIDAMNRVRLVGDCGSTAKARISCLLSSFGFLPK